MTGLSLGFGQPEAVRLKAHRTPKSHPVRRKFHVRQGSGILSSSEDINPSPSALCAFAHLATQPPPHHRHRTAMEVKPENTMRVYISGLKGTHSLRVGIAYWYRGHYLYAVNDTRNPIEPQTFATKGKILINGSTMDTAPIYDVHNEYLIDESEIRALEKAIWTVTYYGPEWQADELDADLTKKRPSVAEVGTRLATPSFGAVQKHYVPESILSTSVFYPRSSSSTHPLTSHQTSAEFPRSHSTPRNFQRRRARGWRS